jgi:hypothetical protein
MKNSFILIFVLLIAVANSLNAQNTTYSPYTLFGIGELETRDLGRNSGMGNVGIGMKSAQSLNRLNPASYSGLDSLTFTFEVSLVGKYSKYSNANISQRNSMANLKKLAMGFRISKFWAASLGLAPFSNVGYNITKNKTIEGSQENYTVNLTGDGGINQVYMGNSVRVFKNLSLGVNVSLLFGTLNHKEEVLSGVSSTNPYIERETYIHRFNFDYGFQFHNKINDDIRYTIGGVLGLNNNMKLDNKVSIYNSDGDSEVSNSNYSGTFTLPMFYGAGFSLSSKGGLTLAGDYRFQKWSDVKSESMVFSYVDSRNYAVGVEYYPQIRLPKNYFQRMFYQAGFTYNQSYLKLRGTQINEYGVSVGVGLPFKHERSFITVSFETGKKGRMVSDLFAENYYQINLNLILKDFWFVKSKFD